MNDGSEEDGSDRLWAACGVSVAALLHLIATALVLINRSH